jgi:hypothetical protein
VIQRQKHSAGKLPVEKQRQLETLPGWAWDPVSEAWETALRQAEEFVKKNGHALVPAAHTTKHGFRLGTWVSAQRARKASLLPAQRKRLEALRGWTWDPLQDAWEEGYQHLKAFVRANGHARVPNAFVTRDRFKLGSWVASQRSRKPNLSIERRRRLIALKGWNWDARLAVWEDGLRHLKQFVSSKGHARVPVAHVTSDGFKLGTWVVTQRRLPLQPDRRARLESVPGWTWGNVIDAAWEQTFGALSAFVKKEGHARVPQSHVTSDGIRLGVWVSKQRGRRGKLSANRRQRLSALPGWSWELRTNTRRA